MLKKRVHKEFEKFRARAIDQSNCSSSDSPDEQSPRTSEDRKSSDEPETWQIRDFAVSTLRNSGNLAQLIGRQIYLQVYERAKNAELDKLMFEEERKASSKKPKKKKRNKKTTKVQEE